MKIFGLNQTFEGLMKKGECHQCGSKKLGIGKIQKYDHDTACVKSLHLLIECKDCGAFYQGDNAEIKEYENYENKHKAMLVAGSTFEEEIKKIDMEPEAREEVLKALRVSTMDTLD